MDRELPISELPNVLRSLKKKRSAFQARAQELAQETHCSFPTGYLSQAVYACLTCTRDEPAGVCVGCYLSCHLHHEVQELGIKSHFRCDCGNGKFQKKCSKCPEKPDFNEENAYNHNYKGRFCFCDAGDSEDTREDDMYMCMGCQDWFHESCIGKANDCHNFAEVVNHQQHVPSIPADSSDYYFLCHRCVSKAAFFPWTYPEFIHYSDPIKRPRDAEGCPVDLTRNAAFPYSIFIKESWVKERCDCEQCRALYSQPPFDTFAIEEEPNVLQKLEEAAENTILSQEEDPEAKDEDDAELKDFMDSVQKYPHAVQMEVAQGVQLFQDTFAQFIGRFREGGVLCPEHIEEFKRELNTKYEAYKRAKHD